MPAANYDVVIVGAGAAGLTAAIGLARAGFSVAVVEAAAFPGAENWSGCVYFCENLAHPDILGPRRRRGAGLGTPPGRTRLLRHATATACWA